MKRPTSLRRLSQSHDVRDTWVPYPRQAEPVPAHTNCLINGLLDLMLIVWDVTNYFFEDELPLRSDVENAVNIFHQRLEQWNSNLPLCMGADTDSTPGIMDMQ